MNPTRQPSVEGRFYPASRQEIFRQIRQIERVGRYPDPGVSPGRIIGAVLPHAGHVYSGYQTVPFFRLLMQQSKMPETVVILHPNHTGAGAPLAIDSHSAWSNAAGTVPVDTQFAAETGLPLDTAAHRDEHSAEVLVPFLQYYLQDQPYSIVPVCMGAQDAGAAVRVSDALRTAAWKTGREILVLASTDFSHFLTPAEGMKQDQFVVDALLQRDMEGIGAAVRKHRVSMCGYGPVMALMDYASKVSSQYRITMLARGHSGEVSPSAEVVDYISFMFHI